MTGRGTLGSVQGPGWSSNWSSRGSDGLSGGGSGWPWRTRLSGLAPVAQGTEQWFPKPRVGGSSPSGGTTLSNSAFVREVPEPHHRSPSACPIRVPRAARRASCSASPACRSLLLELPAVSPAFRQRSHGEALVVAPAIPLGQRTSRTSGGAGTTAWERPADPLAHLLAKQRTAEG